MNKNLDRFEGIDYSFIYEQRDKRIEKAILAKKIRRLMKIGKFLFRTGIVIVFFTLLSKL